MADKPLYSGDKLPGSLLTDNEWNCLKEMDAQFTDKMSFDYRDTIGRQLMRLAKTHCTGDNAGKCLLCGDNQNDPKYGLCFTCTGAFRKRGVLRQSGKTREVKNADLICSLCHSAPAQTLGVCHNCYYKMKRKGFSSVEEYKAYLADKIEKIPNTIFVEK